MLRRVVLLAVLLTFGEAPGYARYFVVRAGTFYDAGDFGTSRNFHTWYFPVTIKGVWDRLDLSLTSAWVYLTTEQKLALSEGTPNPSGAPPPQSSASGPNDTVAKARYCLLLDPGRSSWVPGVSPYVKVKFPTGDPDQQLGTGEADFGFGVGLEKTVEPLFAFADVGYTVIGKPAGENLQNRPSAGGGAGAWLNKKTSLSFELDWRKALVRGFDDPLDLYAILGYRWTPTMQSALYAMKGLSDGSPSYGGGIDVSYKFGIQK